ncbi:MAG: hypothetical protein ACNS60_05285 [Candidatus Cyclobacteriaceae bacterium M2_1C_046]
MYKELNFIIIFSLALTFVGCNGSKDTEESAAEEFEQAQTERSEVKEQIKEVVYEIPSPSEIPYLLEATGAEYDASLVNDISKVDQYSNRNYKAALNLGVYAADIGYLSSYDKVQEALSYMSKTKKLADDLGVSGAFDQKLIRRFEQNLNNKDSLAYLLNETINQVENYLQDENRNKLAALIITGSFIEGLYVSTQLINNYPKDILPDDARNLILTPLIRVVLEQEKAVRDLLELLRSVEQTEPINELITDLESIEKSYEELNIQDQIRNNRADLVLTDANLIDITQKVKETRSFIVE